MSIITSNRQERHDVVDPIFILFFSALAVLTIFALSIGNLSDLVEGVLGYFSSAPASLSVNHEPSFASDQKYWDANCTGKWSSDPMCEAIVARTQSCSISVDSVYCSNYDNYMRNFRK
jgi:hypothetical protein